MAVIWDLPRSPFEDEKTIYHCEQCGALYDEAVNRKDTDKDAYVAGEPDHTASGCGDPNICWRVMYAW